MTNKDDDNVRDLQPQSPGFSPATYMGSALWSSHLSPPEDGSELAREFEKTQFCIDMTAYETRFALSKVGEMHQHASHTFSAACDFIVEIKDRPGRDQQTQACIDQFSAHQIQQLGKQSLYMLELGATRVGTELRQAPYAASDFRGRRRGGLLRKWFG